MAAMNLSVSKLALTGIPADYDLTDRELAILRATRSNSLSTVAIAEQVGLGYDPTLVMPLLDRLEGLDLVNGYFAAGRVMTSTSETHRRYYRLTDLGERVI
jgi:DNA-binding MarR family transcriptional regulator